jgi:hypothetical protein
MVVHCMEKIKGSGDDGDEEEVINKTKLEEFHESNEYRKLMRKHELPMSAYRARSKGSQNMNEPHYSSDQEDTEEQR